MGNAKQISQTSNVIMRGNTLKGDLALNNQFLTSRKDSESNLLQEAIENSKSLISRRS